MVRLQGHQPALGGRGLASGVQSLGAAGLGWGGFGEQSCPSVAAPGPLSLNCTRWASSLDPHFSQSPLSCVAKHMLSGDKV